MSGNGSYQYYPDNNINIVDTDRQLQNEYGDYFNN